jgi:hypothetical protein
MSGTLVAIALYLLGMPIGWILPDDLSLSNMRMVRWLLMVLWPLCGIVVIWFIIWEALQPHLPFNPRNYEDEDI